MKRIVIPATLVAHTLGSFRWRDYARLVADNLAPVCISTDLYIYRHVHVFVHRHISACGCMP